MIAIRCTQVVRTRLGLPPNLPEPPSPTAALGDWYVHLLRFGHQQVVMATSERSLLTVILPARELRKSLATNLRLAVGDLLSSLDVPRAAVQHEIAAMEPAALAKAVNRRVIGSMNELAYQLFGDVELTGDPLELALRLSDTPMSAIGSKSMYGIPREVARELLLASKGGEPNAVSL
jgi:hypothetical protein